MVVFQIASIVLCLVAATLNLIAMLRWRRMERKASDTHFQYLSLTVRAHEVVSAFDPSIDRVMDE